MLGELGWNHVGSLMGWVALLFAVPDILLEHRDFYVVNKPAGIGMHQEPAPPTGGSMDTMTESDDNMMIPGIVRLLSEHLQEPTCGRWRRKE